LPTYEVVTVAMTTWRLTTPIKFRAVLYVLVNLDEEKRGLSAFAEC
jgi:hypothetical protein